MNKVYLHFHKNLKSILVCYFCSLIPLVIYGIYKNGFLLYQKDYISILGLFRPLYFVLIPFLFNIHAVVNANSLELFLVS